jgi:prophage tail gpP-like protein
VNGQDYAGWKSARVTRGIESVAGGFSMSVMDRWGGQRQDWPIAEGDECTVLIAGQVVVTGYVDTREQSFDSSQHGVEVAGRDRTGELVDCSVILRSWEFRSTPVLTLCERIAKPFGIPVALQPGLDLPPPPAKLSVDPGDTAFEVIERACRASALLAVSDGKGGLLLMRPGTNRAQTALVEGQNIKSASRRDDVTGRYRKVVVRGQTNGTDSLFGGSAAAIEANAEDLNVKRSPRVLLVRPEGNVTVAHAKKRAQWETAVRAARALSLSVTVQGWTQADGTLWPVNALVRLRSPTLALDEDFLVTEASYSLDDASGTTTTMTLRPQGAYEPEPVIPKKAKKGLLDLGAE